MTQPVAAPQPRLTLYQRLEPFVGQRWLRDRYYDAVYWWAGYMKLTAFNYGYAPASPDLLADPNVAEPYQLEMYRQAAGAIGEDVLRGKTVLEISSGLGGGLAQLTKHYGIALPVALDLALPALRVAHGKLGLNAVRADAVSLPFADAAFDVVINVEASHAYFTPAFFAELKRVLKRGGALVLIDSRSGRPVKVERAIRKALTGAGFAVTSFRNITGHVAASCRADTPRRERWLRRVPWFLRNSIRERIGVTSSQRYRSYEAGRWTYFIARVEHADT